MPRLNRITTARRPYLWSILTLYLLLTVGYSVINPLFEAPDEHHHFFTAQYVAANGRLPIARLDEEQLRQEAAQPPLYYLLGSLLFTAPHTAVEIWRNPQARLGDASALTNINWAVHDSREAFPWRGFVLDAHLLRLFSTLLGLGTLLCIYSSGRLIWPQQPEVALLATALVAFLPQFNFLHSAVSNDPLIIFLCSATLWQLLHLWYQGGGHGRYFLLGITVGLALLSKNAGTLLLLYATGILLLSWLQDRKSENRGSFILNLLLFLFPALLAGGWLWWRNWQLYGDMTAANIFIAFAGGDRQASLWQVLAEWRSLWPSLFAIFGWFNVRPPQWVYVLWYGMVFTAVAGVIKEGKGWRAASISISRSPISQRWFVAVWLAAWVLAVYAGLVLFMLQTEAAQGRLLFPALLPLALGMAYGLSRFRWRGIYLLAAPLALLTSLFSLWGVIRPVYAWPPLVTALPPAATPLLADLGPGVQLVGVHWEQTTAVPGADLWLTLYWRAMKPVDISPEFTLELLGMHNERLSHTQGFQGRGLFPAALWPTGLIMADRFAFRLADAADVPVLANGYVGLVGERERAAIGAVEVEPQTWPTADAPALTILGDGVELTAMDMLPTAVAPGESVTVSLQWRVMAPPGQDYTTLVHLAEPGQRPLATGDDQPRHGRYPTRLWAAGELINDSYTLTVPPGLVHGRYPVWIGMYDPDTLARLPLTVGHERQPDDLFLVGWLNVTE